MIDTYNLMIDNYIVSDIFKFYNNQCPDYFNEDFCPVDKNGVTALITKN